MIKAPLDTSIDLTTMPRWRGLLDDKPKSSGPWIADLHTFDIEETIARCVRICGAGCVAVVLVDRGGPRMRTAAEQAARDRGVAIIWEDRVADAGLLDDSDTCGVRGKIGVWWPE